MSPVRLHTADCYNDQVGDLLFADEEGGYEVALADGTHHFEESEVERLPLLPGLGECDGAGLAPLHPRPVIGGPS